jgi:hypothetical protein
MRTNSSTHKPKNNPLQKKIQTLKTSYSTKQKTNQKKEQQQQWITQEKHAHTVKVHRTIYQTQQKEFLQLISHSYG